MNHTLQFMSPNPAVYVAAAHLLMKTAIVPRSVSGSQTAEQLQVEVIVLAKAMKPRPVGSALPQKPCPVDRKANPATKAAAVAACSSQAMAICGFLQVKSGCHLAAPQPDNPLAVQLSGLRGFGASRANNNKTRQALGSSSGLRPVCSASSSSHRETDGAKETVRQEHSY